VLDQRHYRSGIYQRAAERGVAIFVRSVFLQGLLLLPDENIPPGLRDVIPVRRQLAELAQASGMTLQELALRYMLSVSEATCLVVGVETVEQVCDNLRLFDRGPLPSDVYAAATALVPELPETLITPRLWS
jgi:aryl-alcohol dehydrogenase-like predicted oxidoreductase